MDWKLYAPGSYCPGLGKTQRDVLLRMDELTGGELVTLTGGEHRKEQKDWVVPFTRRVFTTLAPLRVALSGKRYGHFLARKFLGYAFFLFIAVNIKRGKMPHLPHAEWAADDTAVIHAVKEATGCSMPVMQGMPTPTAWKFFSGVPGFKWLFEQRVVQAARKILRDAPSTVIQFELPAELAFTSMPPWREGRAKTARRMAASIERVIRELPKGSRIAFHLCWGDLRRRPFVQKWMQHSANKVLLINALLELSVWQEGWVLFAVHDPFCDGVNLPSQDPATYDTYDELLPFPDDTIYAVGVLHHQVDAESTAKVARLIGAKLASSGVRKMAIAPPCGDGRKDEDEVVQQWRIAVKALALLNA